VGIPAADINKFEKQMKALDKKVEIHIFPDAGHAFENETNLKAYRKEDADNARKYTVDFLAKNLKY
jgi:carboxymethylenebutenolidase